MSSIIMRLLAKFISLILGPQIWGPFIFYLVFSHAHLTQSQLITVVPLICFINLLVPFLYILIAYKRKKIKDFDLTDKKERVVPLIIFILSFLLTTSLLFTTGLKELGNIFLFFTFILILNGVITLFWKISLHMAVNIIGYLLLIYYYGPIATVFAFIIPLIYWSRLFLKKHTVMQLLMSLLLNGVIAYYFLFASLSIK